MHKNLVKIERVVLEISWRTDRQTHRQTYSSQYFATVPAGEVKIAVVQSVALYISGCRLAKVTKIDRADVS